MCLILIHAFLFWNASHSKHAHSTSNRKSFTKFSSLINYDLHSSTLITIFLSVLVILSFPLHFLHFFPFCYVLPFCCQLCKKSSFIFLFLLIYLRALYFLQLYLHLPHHAYYYSLLFLQRCAIGANLIGFIHPLLSFVVTFVFYLLC